MTETTWLLNFEHCQNISVKLFMILKFSTSRYLEDNIMKMKRDIYCNLYRSNTRLKHFVRTSNIGYQMLHKIIYFRIVPQLKWCL